MKVYLATDHGGFELKETLKPFIESLGHFVEDCGAFSFDKNDDYPVFIMAAAKKLSEDVVSGKTDSLAIIAGGSGQGEAMAANRFIGVRAAVYYGEAGKPQTDASGKTIDIITSTRDHNDANALSLAGRFLTLDESKRAVQRFLELPFSGDERHVRRIAMLDSEL